MGLAVTGNFVGIATGATVGFEVTVGVIVTGVCDGALLVGGSTFGIWVGILVGLTVLGVLEGFLEGILDEGTVVYAYGAGVGVGALVV